jgi:hypothetical protein
LADAGLWGLSFSTKEKKLYTIKGEDSSKIIIKIP